MTCTDMYHGALPYSMQICNDETQLSTIYEWSVNPLTRTPLIDPNELQLIVEQLSNTDSIVAHHTKIDLKALDTACSVIRPDLLQSYEWDWINIHDSLIMAHCWKNLWSHGLKHLREVLFFVDGYNQQLLLDATNKARRICRTKKFNEFIMDSINDGLEEYGNNDYYDDNPNCTHVTQLSKSQLLQIAQDNKEQVNSPWRIAGPQDPHWPGIKRSPSLPKKKNQLSEDNEAEDKGWAFYDMWLPKCIAEYAPIFLPEEEQENVSRKSSTRFSERQDTDTNRLNRQTNRSSNRDNESNSKETGSTRTTNRNLQTETKRFQNSSKSYRWSNSELQPTNKHTGINTRTNTTKIETLRNHSWFRLSHTYGIEDVETTLPLFTFLKQQLQDEDLWEQYLDRQKLLQITYEMQQYGVTLLPDKLETEITRYKEISHESREQARKIATTVIQRETRRNEETTELRGGTTNNKGTTGTTRKVSRRKTTRDIIKTSGSNNKSSRSPKAINRTKSRRSNNSNGKTRSGSSRSKVRTSNKDSSTPIIISTQTEQSFNIDSGLQIRNLLYDRFKLPITKRTDKSKTFPNGQASVNVDTLEALANPMCGNTSNEAREFINHLLLSKKHTKATNSLTSYKNWGTNERTIHARANKYITEITNSFSKIHSSINICGTRFTRQSTNDPNLQNVGTGDTTDGGEKDFLLRSVFGPRRDLEWLSIDFQSIEAIIWAYAVKNKEIMSDVRNDITPFKVMMEAVWGYFDKDDKHYKPVKNGFYSIIYGAKKSHSDNIFGKEGAVNSIIKRIPQVRSFTNQLHREIIKRGYITTIGGYRLYIPRNEPHKAVSGFIQGHAGWVIGQAMILCQEYLRQIKSVCMILQVHDEIIFEGPVGFHKTIGKELARLMSKAGEQYNIPTPVNMTLIKDNWAEGEEIT